jgi:hypothetical protein
MIHPPPTRTPSAGRAFLAERGIPADRIAETSLGVMPKADRLRLALQAKGNTSTEIDASHLLADTRCQAASSAPGATTTTRPPPCGHAQSTLTRSRATCTCSAHRAAPESLTADVWVIDPDLLGQAKDPGNLIRTGGRDAWHAASAAHVCGVTWRVLDLTGPLDHPRTELVRRAALARAGAWLGALPARCAIEQSAALNHVAESLAYDRDAVRRAFRARYWQPCATRETPPTASIQR